MYQLDCFFFFSNLFTNAAILLPRRHVISIEQKKIVLFVYVCMILEHSTGTEGIWGRSEHDAPEVRRVGQGRNDQSA